MRYCESSVKNNALKPFERRDTRISSYIQKETHVHVIISHLYLHSKCISNLYDIYTKPVLRD